ncbi:hypothetical protein GPECTOR_9g441 [Gonium pectorale]|uniref:Uncharacterized protein n=1 Tax=Gonium pectorale TaxID=33097 RepID=A0A150GRG4_GONPE|nr:hypothetical protein GPECTOR_9g441 [Gonium pectorale]|eukprot:KXZ52397.1 hypothetical protein GPECTOR_9g441 [Gonium pectorale]
MSWFRSSHGARSEPFPVYASMQLLEQKERELMESIAANYGRIREVERELGNLQLQLKLTAGPKKHALELLRRKIETQNERVASIRSKHSAAKATYERLDAELKAEEAAKDQLCNELNTLVQQAARAQLDKLEELKNHLESLYSTTLPRQAAQPGPQAATAAPAGPSAGPASDASSAGPPQQNGSGPPGNAGPSGQAAAVPAAAAQTQQQQAQQDEQERLRQEQERKRQQAEAEAAERRRREAEAAAARSRHVSLNPHASLNGAAASAPATGASSAGRTGAAGAAGAGTGPAQGRPRPSRPATGSAAGPLGAGFSGFDT